ncbi:hypothetical protein SARC_04925, partial [Sphaeroforma arctica JP610]
MHSKRLLHTILFLQVCYQCKPSRMVHQPLRSESCSGDTSSPSSDYGSIDYFSTAQNVTPTADVSNGKKKYTAARASRDSSQDDINSSTAYRPVHSKIPKLKDRVT